MTLQRFLGRYLMRHPFAVDRIVIKKNKVEVVSTKESVITWKGTPLEFLARISPHIPNHYEHMERFYGLYSPVIRGALTAKKQQIPHSHTDPIHTDPIDPFESNNSRSTASWAKCIKLVYEINPMECPICKGQMKIIAFILDQLRDTENPKGCRSPKLSRPSSIRSQFPTDS